MQSYQILTAQCQAKVLKLLEGHADLVRGLHNFLPCRSKSGRSGGKKTNKPGVVAKGGLGVVRKPIHAAKRVVRELEQEIDSEPEPAPVEDDLDTDIHLEVRERPKRSRQPVHYKEEAGIGDEWQGMEEVGNCSESYESTIDMTLGAGPAFEPPGVAQE